MQTGRRGARLPSRLPLPPPKRPAAASAPASCSRPGAQLAPFVHPPRESAKKKDVRLMNIEAAKAVADAIRTSLGPRGMDKMVRCVLGAGQACFRC